MSFTSWLRNVRSAHARRRVERKHRQQKSHRVATHRLRLELLEDRTLLSTFMVLNLDDSGAGSLRQAVLDANDNPGADLIRFAPSARDGTIALISGELSSTDDLTIDGQGVHRLTISGSDASRVFNVSGSTTDMAIRDLTIANGRATGATAVGPFGPVTLGGGLLNTGAHVSLSHVTLENNQAVGNIAQGGAIANVSGATLEITQSRFTDNRAAGTSRGTAGAIANDGGSALVLDHSTLTGNQATASLGAGPGIQGNALSGALVNAGGSQATVAHSTFASNLARGGNGADGGPGQNGGNAGTGVGGAIGNEGISLLVPFASSTMTVDHSTFLGNQATGGTGGNGGAGGNGGSVGGVGIASPGGAINNGSSTLTVTHSTFLDNQAFGGNGGNGGAGGNGGVGGTSSGGAISSIRSPIALTGGIPVRATLHVGHSLFLGNEAIGGAGGAGGSGGNGGAGGLGQGGGLRTLFTDWEVDHSSFVLNQATGGVGGDKGSGGLLGGAGGAGQGGGLFNVNGSIGAVSQSVVVHNTATGGAGGLGGNGGNGQGGGVFNGGTSPDGAPSLTFRRSMIIINRADGGAAGIGGSDGQGLGGGLYVSPGGTACADLFAAILANDASTSDDDVFGVLCFI